MKKETTTTVECKCTPMIDRPTFIDGYVTSDKSIENQLTKAIELLNDVLLMAKVERLKGRYETVDEIEKFLKDIEH